MKPKFIKPAYIISMNAINCQLEVKCNGINVFEYKSKASAKGGGMSISVPINHLLLENKKFDIVATVLPAHNKKALEITSYAKIEILMLDYIAPTKTSIKLFQTETPDQSTDNPNISPKIPIKGLPLYKLKAFSSAEILPFKLIGWQKSISLIDYNSQSLLLDAFNYYQKIESIINQKNANKFMEITSERDKILETTYYYGAKEIERERLMLREIFNESGLNVIPFSLRDIEIEFMGKDSQLIRLKRRNGLPVLMLYNPLNQKTVKLDIKLHKKNLNSPLSII